ncbi:Uncharacterized protein PBTT_00949 [Plasmodiophora brassicae]|uniref:Uncharacterized protein n=1 Tax=Plasmodiophora brassicae TaxID=37360 RepID=A0A0G4IUE9_PLABS|nr:hypothetical protein PBRA_006976 [Plasmodiophora brassicae]SPQ92934.1 unnamed protein product [Plasmodiophora brassicae]
MAQVVVEVPPGNDDKAAVRFSRTRGINAAIAAAALSGLCTIGTALCAYVVVVSQDAPPSVPGSELVSRKFLAAVGFLVLSGLAVFLATLPMRLVRITVEFRGDRVALLHRNGLLSTDTTLQSVDADDFLGVAVVDSEGDASRRVEFRWRDKQSSVHLSAAFERIWTHDQKLDEFVARIDRQCYEV